MSSDKTDKNWEFYGKNDPYFGVLTAPEFRAVNLTDAVKEQFFTSGQDHIDSMFAIIRSSLSPAFLPESALDFGCGAGRLVIPLADQCDRVVGVDVSASMLEEAQVNCDARGVKNVEFVLSDDALSRLTGTFDFIHSYIVFQHIPRDRGEKILKELITHLMPGGVGALHFTYLRKATPLRKCIYWARNHIPAVNALVNLYLGQPINYPAMEMNEYDLNRLFLILQESGCGQTYVRFSEHPSAATNTYGVLLFFQKQSFSTF